MPALRLPRALAVAALSACVLLQLVVLYAPQAPGPPSPIPHGDKAIHALVFALPVVVAGVARTVRWQVVAVLGALHAPVSEVIQHVALSQRSGDPWDVVADLVGVVAASVGVSWIVRRLRCRRS